MVEYVEAAHAECDVRKLIARLVLEGCTRISFYDVCDDWLEQRLHRACEQHGIVWQEHPTPMPSACYGPKPRVTPCQRGPICPRRNRARPIIPAPITTPAPSRLITGRLTAVV